MIRILFSNFFEYDWIIFLLFGINCGVFGYCFWTAKKVYDHFNEIDRTVNLIDDSKEAIQANSAPEKKITSKELLDYRATTNKLYGWFTTITSVFPLFGMLGTVISLIKMGDLIGTDVQSAFYLALTSTCFGIVAALVSKFMDAFVAYMIDDNEKHLEYLFNPKKGE